MVDANTAVTITMRSLISGILALVVSGGLVLWAVLTFVIGGTREDISAIRQSLDRMNTEVQTIDREGVSRTSDLGKQISDLRVETTKLTSQLATFGTKLDFTSKSVDSLNAGLGITNKSVDSLSLGLGTTIKSVESLSAGLGTTGKSMEELSARLDKFQAQLVSMSSPEFDSRRLQPLIDALKKNGVSEQNIIVVPLR
jgi:septal ring factor EnvC (AmiA/AmiB activator)